MQTFWEIVQKPWPWYVAGPIIGLIVPTLLLIGNKTFGLSSNLRHICAAIIPTKASFFKYDWKKEKWNLFFVLGIIIGGFIATHFLSNPNDIIVDEQLKTQLATYDIHDFSHIVPYDLFNIQSLLTPRGFILIIVGGFFIGFGTRYANGCTSGHAIMGLSNLQWPSLVATVCFMLGGFLTANYLLPIILNWK